MRKAQKETSSGVVMGTEVVNSVNVGDLVQIAVAAHEQKLEELEEHTMSLLKTVKKDIEVASSDITKAVYTKVKKAFKSQNLQELKLRLEEFFQERFELDFEVVGYTKDPSTSTITQVNYEVAGYISDNSIFTRPFHVNPPKDLEALFKKKQDLKDARGNLGDLLNKIRKESQEIDKLERRAIAAIATYNLTHEVGGGKDLLAKLTSNLLGSSSVLYVKELP